MSQTGICLIMCQRSDLYLSAFETFSVLLSASKEAFLLKSVSKSGICFTRCLQSGLLSSVGSGLLLSSYRVVVLPARQRNIGIPLSLFVCLCLCLSSSHAFLVVRSLCVSQATNAFLGILPLWCLCYTFVYECLK